MTGDGTSDEGPSGEGETDEASVWPVPTALGVAGLYATAALVVLGGAGPPGTVPMATALSVGSLAVGVGGWICRWTLSVDHEARPSRTVEVAVLAFLATEAATFGGGFAYFLFLWSGPWSLRPLPPVRPLATLAATLTLLASSVTLHEARAAALRDDRPGVDRYLSATVGLGALFLVGQAGEYHELSAAGITPTSGAYAAAFYGLTGLHGLHVLGGLGAMVALRAVIRRRGSATETALTAIARYWHLVDAVWVVLVATLYVGVRVVP